MSTAASVPEAGAHGLVDAARTVRSTGLRTTLAASFTRMRWADGFNHSRAVAFLFALLRIQGLFALVGLAGVLGQGAAVDVVERSVELVVPGPAGRTLITAVTQTRDLEPTRRALPLVFGVTDSLVVATTAVGQVERGLNRIYGNERDRPTLRKYGLAFVLSAGVLAGVAFVLLALGGSIGTSLQSTALDQTWRWARLPSGVALLGVVTVLFRWSPRRRQPTGGAVTVGAVIAVASAAVVTAGLGLFFRFASAFGDAYGPLAGSVALLVWALATSMSLFFGAAVAAEVESRCADLRPSSPEHRERAPGLAADGAGDVESTRTAALRGRSGKLAATNR